MQLQVEFTDKRIDDNCFDILLTKIAFSRCNNIFDGEIYVHKDVKIDFDAVIGYLQLKSRKLINIGNIRFNKKIDACLCLLVNPYFDKTVEYIKIKSNELSVCFLKMLKKQIFSYLVDELTVQIFSYPDVEGADFYKNHNCFNVSNEVLEIINKKINSKSVRRGYN